jgi:hypothetical protein
MTERRVFSLLPKYFQTDVNKRLLGATDDLVFEPEDFERIEGQIGDDTDVSESDKARSPFLPNLNPEDDRYQLAPCVVTYNKDGSVANGSFYSDLVGHILANGGITTDESRLFECEYFSFNPPIVVDHWVNFSKYFWTGDGTAADNGVYFVKEPTASQTVLYYVETDGSTTKKSVILDSSGLLGAGATYNPSGNTTGALREDCTDAERAIYRWDGSAWQIVNLYPIDDLDNLPAGINAGTYVYVARVGKEFQRPVIFHYSSKAGRWISKTPVIANVEPTNPVEGMIWEDSRTGSTRKFLIYDNESWVPLTYSHVTTMTGIGTPGEGDNVYRYSANDFSASDDPWQKESWWVHYEDFSPTDKSKYAGNQSSRPIIKFWSSIEQYNLSDAIAQYNIYGLNTKNNPLRKPLFEVYMLDDGAIAKVSTLTNTDSTPITFNGNSIFEYKVTSSNVEDEILNLKPTYDSTGELVFDLTLDSAQYYKDNALIKGYRFFKDTWTNKIHSVWTKSVDTLSYDQSSKTVPLNLSNNPNHDNITSISRSNIINHYRNIISSNSTGIPLGDNSYRWTDHDPVNGATIIDTEGSLLIPMALVQDDQYDLAESIRMMAFEYNRFMRRFHNRLKTLWNSGSYSTPDGVLSGVTATQMVDKVISAVTLFSDSSTPFWNSDMGTYVDETTSTTKPILIPPSVSRVGAGPAYAPRKYTTGSITYILCHDGTVLTAYGDDRDDVILNLENRFYAKVTAKRKLETVSESAFLDGHQFSLRNFVGNRTPDTNIDAVDDIVNDYTAVVSPAADDRYYSKTHGSYVTYNGSSWVVRKAIAGDVFLDNDENKTYIFNGFDIFELKTYNRNGSFDYSTTDYYAVIRREFERWYVDQGLDPISNSSYDSSDEWTWNYHSFGFEGNWAGLYKRVYGTDRPHVAPWEILGFTIEPEWWTDAYTADSTDSDGNKRYNASNGMWADLKTGTLIAAEGVEIPTKFLLNSDAPVPVDASGNLVDPITSGLVSLDQVLNPERDWNYGDYSPIEQQFNNSYLGPYAYALAGYLMKPARFVEFLWSDYSFTIGMDQSLFGGPITVDDETLKRPKLSDLKIHSEEENLSNPGINAWIAETLNLSRISPVAFGDMLRNTNVSLGWKTNGFIDKKSTIIKTPSGVEIPFEDVQLAVHKGLPVESKFHSGVQILKRGSKYQVYGYDYTNPFFKINYSARPSIGGRTTIEETYTSQDGITSFTLTKFKVGSENDIAKFTVLIDGFKVDSKYINITSATTFEIFDPKLSSGQQVSAQLTTTYTNPSTRSRKFSIGDTDYFYYTYRTNTIIEYPYGHQFNSPQEVVEFLADHGNYMEDQGWEYVAGDDWVDVAKRFASWSQTATNNQIFVDVPSGLELTLKSSFGHLANIEKLVYGGYSLLDIAALPIKEFDTYRFDDKVTVKTSELIFGLRANIVDYQHAVFISNKTRFNDLVYDPFTGLRQKRLEIKSLRTKEWAGRIETPGYVILDDALIPNFEKYTKDFIRYYDMHNPVSDPKFRDQAFNLYGWYYKDYMREMNINDIQALKFHKSAIREKGTRRAVSGFSVAKDNEAPLEIYECWAWKEGEFGKTPYDNPIRFSLFESDFRNRIQGVKFGTTDESNVIEVTNYDRSASHDRWVVAPRGTNFEFPMTGDIPSSDYDIRLVVLEDETVSKKMFHFDPSNGLHEPNAYSQIDIETAFDPAYYNKGTARTGEGFEWAETRVGTIWWDTTYREYADYHNTSLTIKEAAELWGSLKKFSISNTTFANSSTKLTSTVEAGHNFVVDQAIIVENKEGRRLNGVIDGVSGNSITYTLFDGPETIAILNNPILLSNLVSMTNRSIDVYEWIESKVPPSQFTSEDGDVSVYNPLDPSYTEVTRSDNSKRYYFWVTNRKTVANGKFLSIYQISNQLRDPTSNLLPWFGVLNKNSMIFNASSLETRNDLSIQVFTYPKQHEEHDQWAILVEDDNRSYVNESTVEKIIDSLQGSDYYGNTVPADFRTDLDKYGSEVGQIIFSDVDTAKTVFLSSLNRNLKKYDKAQTLGFTTAFPAASKYPTSSTGYWEETLYDLVNIPPSQIVNSISERDALIDLFIGDIVKVNTNPYEVYQYTSTGWEKVQAENSSAKVNSNIFTSLRSIMELIKEFLSIQDYNRVMFDMIYEMMRQRNNCNWCFKTSYIDVINTVNTGQPSSTPFDEMDVVIKSVNDMKPYHSKIRRAIASHVINNGDDAFDLADMTVTDQNYTKTTIFTDRLSFNTFDDNAFDTEPFDVKEFDYQTWDRSVLGTDNYEIISTFQKNGNQKRFYIGKTFPYLEHYITGTNQTTGRSELVPIYNLLFDNEELTVVFETAPPSGVTYRVYRAFGYASPGLITKTTIDDDFETIDATYRHAVAVAGVGWQDIAGDGVDVDDLDGGDADERIRSEVSDKSIIETTTYYTGLYAGFDAVPLDTAPYDTALMPTAETMFSENINNDYQSLSLTETINPVQTITLASDTNSGAVFMFTDGRFTVGRVQIDTGSGYSDVDSADYDVFENNAIRLYQALSSGDKVRLRASRINLKSNFFRIANNDFDDYEIDNSVFIINDLQYANGASFDIEYYQDSLYSLRGSNELFGTRPNTVDDIQDDYTQLTSTTNLVVGYTVINRADNRIYTWGGSSWTSVAAGAGSSFCVRSELQRYYFDGSAWDVTYTIGDGTENLIYKYNGITTASILGGSDYAVDYNLASWKIQHISPPTNTDDIMGYWNFNSIKGEGYNGDIFYWADASGNGNNLIQLDDTKTPTYTENNDPTTNTVDFTSGKTFVVNDASLTGAFSSDGELIISFSVTSVSSFTLLNKASEWAISIDTGSAGDYKVIFTHLFDGTNGTWEIEDTELATGDIITIKITYDSSSVNNNPIINLNGVNKTSTQTSTPAGTAGSATSDLTFNNTGSFKLVSVLILGVPAEYENIISNTQITTEDGNTLNTEDDNTIIT